MNRQIAEKYPWRNTMNEIREEIRTEYGTPGPDPNVFDRATLDVPADKAGDIMSQMRRGTFYDQQAADSTVVGLHDTGFPGGEKQREADAWIKNLTDTYYTQQGEDMLEYESILDGEYAQADDLQTLNQQHRMKIGQEFELCRALYQ